MGKQLPASIRAIGNAFFRRTPPDRPHIDWTMVREAESAVFPEDAGRDAIFRFVVSDVRLEVPLRIMQPDLWRSLFHGYYETNEIAALQYAVSSGDTVLEIGAGIGFISCFVRTKLQAAHVIAVEADPDLIPIIAHTHEINGTAADILNFAVAAADGDVEFNRQPAFWASSLVGLPGGTPIRLRARALQDVLEEIDPDVLIVDTEGAEASMFQRFKPTPRLRHVVVEVHKPQIGLGGIAACVAALNKARMAFDPDGSANTNIVFSRF